MLTYHNYICKITNKFSRHVSHGFTHWKNDHTVCEYTMNVHMRTINVQMCTYLCMYCTVSHRNFTGKKFCWGSIQRKLIRWNFLWCEK